MLKIDQEKASYPSSSSSIQLKAQNAVEQVLKSKPGGLKEIEAQLDVANQWQGQLKDFKLKHTEFYLVGIGGSSLGVQVLAEVFQIKNFHFIDNVDAFHFETQLKSIADLKQTAWIFVSKSGRTIETLAALELIQQFYQENSMPLSEHSLVITEEKKSDLFNWAIDQKIPVFPIPLTVGGRFSILSAVGLIPAILMGLNLAKIKSGVLKAYDEKANLICMTDSILASFARQEWITMLWSYSSRLKSFGFWWQQLWAESLAKKTNLKNQPAERVSTPVPLVGATDQHSVLQQVMDGAKDKMVIFLRVDTAESGHMMLQNPRLGETQNLRYKTLGHLLKIEAEATQSALSEVGVANLTLQVKNLDEENVAFLFMFFQLLVMSLGEALDINPFDQPGVELGKVMAKKMLGEKNPSFKNTYLEK